MSWRTVYITSRCKLDMSLGYMEIRKDDVKKIHLSEIAILVLESTSISMTAALLSELVKRKVKIIFCDERRNPLAELMPIYGSFDSSSKLRRQISWKKPYKDLLWALIVEEKIRKQQSVLLYIGEHARANLLGQYANSVLTADISNREGHAAKVYFGGLFGVSFSRSDDTPINHALNYGYSILLSAFNREIVANGYVTQLGIFHDNMFNPFNFACDLVEPFRPLVDRLVYDLNPNEFDKAIKFELVDLLNKRFIIDASSHTLLNTIKIYCKSVFNALNENDMEHLRFYRHEL